MKVSEAIATRKSIRAFRADPVSADTIRDIVELAARAPSGANLQPWHVHILVGEAREALIRRVKERMPESPRGEKPDYHIHPPELGEPYTSRFFRAGEKMYTALGIRRDDEAARLRQSARNWEFFGAPVGLIFTIDRQMQHGQWADVGMFLQNIMLLAREHGLHSCAQEAWAVWPNLIREFLALPEDRLVYCGMAIGYPDETAPVNQFTSERAPFGEYASVLSTVHK